MMKTNMANEIWIKNRVEMRNKIMNGKTRENKKGLWLWCERFANLTRLILHVYFRALQKKLSLLGKTFYKLSEEVFQILIIKTAIFSGIQSCYVKRH